MQFSQIDICYTLLFMAQFNAAVSIQKAPTILNKKGPTGQFDWN